MKIRTSLLSVFVLLALASVATAQSPPPSPAPPTDFVATDTPSDKGESVDLEWSMSPAWLKSGE